MSHSSSAPPAPQTEKTFTSYNKEQGKVYAQTRLDYHPTVYEAITDYHTSTGGELDTLLDVGCGPGNVTRRLAPHFTKAIGFDPSEGMIDTARSLTEPLATASVRFEVATAEDLGTQLSPPIADASIDLITAANAAHWFDMPRFWASAARVLKPGGSVILWTSGDIRTHPSTANAEAIQAALDRCHEQYLKPYFTPGNLLARNRYIDLPLPWTLEKPVEAFESGSFLRKEWDPAHDFFVGQQESNLDIFEKVMGTASAVTRWRQANPGAVGTEKDVVRMLRRDIEQLLQEAGVEPGKEKLKGSVYGVLLIVKKKG